MNLKIETDLVSVTTHFKDLGNPPWGKTAVLQSPSETRTLTLRLPPGDGASQDGRDPGAMAEARVDIRRLQQFLMGQQVNPSRAMCSKSPAVPAGKISALVELYKLCLSDG